MGAGSRFERTAAILAIISAPIAYASLASLVMAVGGNPGMLDHPLAFLQVDARGAALSRAGMILDMLGYYLLIIPLILVLRRRLKPEGNDWADLAAFCLLSYALLGAAGAAVLAASVPSLAAAYPTAVGEHRTVLEIVYTTLVSAITVGVWNLLEELLAGVGWIIIGVLLLRSQRQLGILTIVLGSSACLDSVGVMAARDSVAAVGRNLYLVLAPAWALWVGTALLRRPAQTPGLRVRTAPTTS